MDENSYIYIYTDKATIYKTYCNDRESGVLAAARIDEDRFAALRFSVSLENQLDMPLK